MTRHEWQPENRRYTEFAIYLLTLGTSDWHTCSVDEESQANKQWTPRT